MMAATRSAISGLGQLFLLQAKGQVLFNRHIGKQRIMLEHHADAAMLRFNRGDIPAIDADGALVGRRKPRHRAQKRGLSAARRPDQHADLSLIDIEVDVFKHHGFAEAL